MLVHIRDVQGNIVESVNWETYYNKIKEETQILKDKLHRRNMQIKDLKEQQLLTVKKVR